MHTSTHSYQEPSYLGTFYHQSCDASQQVSRSGITYVPSVCMDSSATCEQDQLLFTVNRDILIVHTLVIFCCSPPTMRWGFNTRRRVHSIPEEEKEEEGVVKLLRNLNPNKATGPDEISAQLLKTNAKQLAEPLSKLFRHQ